MQAGHLVREDEGKEELNEEEELLHGSSTSKQSHRINTSQHGIGLKASR